jgi:NAD(P)-dependent dehydrogenase (short-subunit alcohol dehydrogenase family)
MTTMKTAIVTGASSGIGLGVTIALMKHGYRVVANSRQITQAGTLIASPDLALVDGDIAHPETARNIVETAVRRFGSIDLLVNNAGIFISKPFTEYTQTTSIGWCRPTSRAFSTSHNKPYSRCGHKATVTS